MSHLHMPDGVLPPWLLIVGWLATGLVVLVVARRLKGEEARRLPLLGVMAALMIVGMMAEIVPIGYHLNLSVLAGIVLGPGLGFLAAFIVNLIIAMFGHGGITVVGINALVIGSETAAGYYLFRGLWRVLGRRFGSPGITAGLATVLSLLASTLIMIGIVGISNVDPERQNSQATTEAAALSFQNPFGEGVLRLEVFAEPHAAESGGRTSTDLRTFAILVLLLGAIGWAIEGVAIGAIVAYVGRVRPDLIGSLTATK